MPRAVEPITVSWEEAGHQGPSKAGRGPLTRRRPRQICCGTRTAGCASIKGKAAVPHRVAFCADGENVKSKNTDLGKYFSGVQHLAVGLPLSRHCVPLPEKGAVRAGSGHCHSHWPSRFWDPKLSPKITNNKSAKCLHGSSAGN